MTKIIIVGAGFAGTSAALNLARYFKADKSTHIVLVDRNDYHLFTPSLSKTATTEEEFTEINRIKNRVSLPIAEIIKGLPINFIRGELQNIDIASRQITVGVRKLEYDYLILATGLVPDFMHIEGAEENSFVLKTLTDALRIRNQIEFLVQARRFDISKKTLRFVIYGGNCKAANLAGDLSGLLDVVAWKNSYPRDRLEIMLIEPSGGLLPAFGGSFGRLAFARLSDLGVQVKFHSRLVHTSRHLLEFINGEKMDYGMLIWAAGCKADISAFGPHFVLDKYGKIPVNGCLQMKGFDNIFAIGEAAGISEGGAQPAPFAFLNAVEQGKYLAVALPIIMKNQKSKVFKLQKHSLIVSIGNKWAIYGSDNIHLEGFVAYLINLFSHFRYYQPLVGIRQAFHYIFREIKL